MKPKIYLVVAADLKGGIGYQGKLPWHLPGDLKFFKDITVKTDDVQLRNMVLMGRVTWESIPEKNRPLEGRKNVVVTRNKDYKVPEGVTVAHSIEAALKKADERVADVYVIGGAKIFDQFMKRYKVDGIYLTKVMKEFKCDAHFPKIPKAFKPEKLGAAKDGDVSYEFVLYRKKKK